MPAHTKAHRTSQKVQVVIMGDHPRVYEVPSNKANAVAGLLSDCVSDAIHVKPNEVFSELRKRYSQAGMRIRGGRAKQNLTQIELAKKIGVTQGDLSKMESGKRAIGKQIAKRLALALRVDYRLFL